MPGIMKKLDPHVVCAAFNKARMENQDLYFSVEEMKRLLKKYNIGTYLVPKMMSLNFFKRFRKGKGFSLSFTSEPIYEAQFRTLLKKKIVSQDSSKEEEEVAIALLKSKGYRIFREDGINIEMLQKKYPDVYDSVKKEVDI